MNSVISAFSLFVLVLISGCFTLPIVDRITNLSPFDHDLTTEKMSVSDIEPGFEIKEVSGDHSEFTTGHNVVSTDGIKYAYAVDEVIPSERFNHMITKDFDASKPGVKDSYAVDEHIPSERFEHHPNIFEVDAPKRAFDDLEMTTEAFDHVTRSFDMDFEQTTDFEPSKRFLDESTFDTAERTIEDKTDFTTELINSTMDMERTTDSMTTFTPTFTPETQTTELFTTTFTPAVTTEKFVGHLDDETVHEEEHEKENVKIEKPLKTKSSHQPKTKPTTDELDDDKKDSKIPEAEFDQSGSDKFDKYLSPIMIFDDKHDVITDPSIKLTTDMMKNETTEKMLNQGEESSHTEEKESDH